MKKKKLSLEEYIKQATNNIRDDRAVTSTLLTELMVHMKSQGEHSHETMGVIAAKYVETLQRSNEQMVKLSSILQKELGKTESLDLTEDDKERMFDTIKKERDDG